MGLRDLIGGFVRADPPLSEIEPYQRAGSDAYALFEKAPAASWTCLAAWNAFLPQVYGDNLIAASSSGRYVASEAIVFARQLFELANTWVEEVRKTEASEAYRFVFEVPYPLPHWVGELRSDPQLTAMRATLDTGRTRIAYGVERFSGEATSRDRLHVLLAEGDAEAVYVERLGTGKLTPELRRTISFELAQVLDHVYELGQLLAQPDLFRPRLTV